MNDEDYDQYLIGLVIREHCLEAARQAYEEAALSGICETGRIELVLDAIDTLDIRKIIKHNRNIES